MLENVAANDKAAPQDLGLIDELNHRVANEFAEAIATISIAAARAPCQHSRASLEHATERMLAHADLHRSLLRPAAEQMNLAEHLNRICSAFCRASLAERGVGIHLAAEDVRLSGDRCWRIGLIVAELIRNAARHGLPGGRGTILVDVWRGDGRVLGLVCDTGRSSSRRPAGAGQKLVAALARDLGGVIDWRFTENGCLVHLDVPTDIVPADAHR